ncbi:DUF2269 family protein [Erythrobacter sp.]|jgi:uncharacterized membrane protein|uniref:DUF2269 family protein n=1 Tax=Erythrobacter sp. TaxID=1042 RepID=UPI002EA60403|nr:DUF2269 domain-containing protein [Erythrobacter sp.]
MTVYYLLLFLHYTGIILLVGNITVTAIWKVFANRSDNPVIVAFGQRLVTGTDFGLTIPGIALTMIGGYGAAWWIGWPLFGEVWLIWSQALFVLAGSIWLGILVPIQIRQARLAHAFADGGTISAEYRRLSRRWITWGLISTVPMVAILWLMIAKPA